MNKEEAIAHIDNAIKEAFKGSSFQVDEWKLQFSFSRFQNGVVQGGWDTIYSPDREQSGVDRMISALEAE